MGIVIFLSGIALGAIVMYFVYPKFFLVQATKKPAKIVPKAKSKSKTLAKEIPPPVREKSPNVWLENNFNEFPAELDEIIKIYKSGSLPFLNELESLTQANLEILYKQGAFPELHKEKERVFTVLLSKIPEEKLLQFYYIWAHSGRKEEEYIAAKIIPTIEGWDREYVEKFDVLEVTHQGKLFKYLELGKVNLPSSATYQPYVIKQLTPASKKDDEKNEKAG